MHHRVVEQPSRPWILARPRDPLWQKFSCLEYVLELRLWSSRISMLLSYMNEFGFVWYQSFDEQSPRSFTSKGERMKRKEMVRAGKEGED